MASTLAAVARAVAKATVAARARDAAIRDAHRGGATLRSIAAAAELSPARVHQIVRGETARP